MEFIEFKTSSEIEYMQCNFSHIVRSECAIQVDGQSTSHITQFRCLGSVILEDGEIKKDETHKIKARWLNGNMFFKFYVIVKCHCS